jgi:hypothetical protein
MITIIIVLVAITISNLFAQNKSNLHFGAHYFNIEDEKFALDFFNIGYQKDLNKRFNWDTNLGFINYGRANKSSIISENNFIINPEDNFFYNNNNTSMICLNTRIGYSFIANKQMKLGLAMGVTVVMAKESRFLTGVSSYNPNSGFITSSSYNIYETKFDNGLAPKLYYERIINNKISLEGAAEIYFHLRNEVSYIYALGLRVNYQL